MTPSVRRPNLLNSILQVLLVVNILGFVVATIWMFITGTACTIYIYGSISIYCLLSTVGVTLVQRWYKFGVLICLVACVAECAFLKIWAASLISSDYPSFSSFPLLENSIPLIIMGCIFLIIALPLFIFKATPSGKPIWSEMKCGMDVAHSRHIYQLTTFLFVGVCIAMWLYSPSTIKANPTVEIKPVEEEIPEERVVDYTLLDSVDVTLNEIAAIETMLDSIPADLRRVYDRRIFALKHVILSSLMSDNHDPAILKNICKIHAGEFSDNQQRVIDWYFGLAPDEQAIWFDCPAVNSLYTFEQEIKQRIPTKTK